MRIRSGLLDIVRWFDTVSHGELQGLGIRKKKKKNPNKPFVEVGLHRNDCLRVLGEWCCSMFAFVRDRKFECFSRFEQFLCLLVWFATFWWCCWNLLQLDTYHLESSAKAVKHSLHVAAFLHGDDSGVVFLVHPDQEVLGLVVPDAPGIRPVASHSRCQKQGRDGLVEQEVILQSKMLWSQWILVPVFDMAVFQWATSDFKLFSRATLT